eukprot:NODE_13632_length_1155_cov_3.575875.p3 GENE.NODE_13632_length_1155_cov_3.575875~~NODE_13632_length_1155_cov_3.575875.p3  ORF type:complete len:117 (-),score=23.68 NODE_13632_length_1155_cov_3.575875:661-1011(-)
MSKRERTGPPSWAPSCWCGECEEPIWGLRSEVTRLMSREREERLIENASQRTNFSEEFTAFTASRGSEHRRPPQGSTSCEGRVCDALPTSEGLAATVAAVDRVQRRARSPVCVAVL